MRWASPHWTEKRDRFLRSQLSAITEQAFATQYLNRWAVNRDGWIPADTWAAAETTDEVDTPPDMVAVEHGVDGARFAAVAGWRLDGGRMLARSFATLSPSAMWSWIDEKRPRLLLPPGLADQYAGRWKVERVGQRASARYLPSASRVIMDGLLLHHHTDQALTEDMLGTTMVATESGQRISRHRSTGPVEATRALVWVIGALPKPAPVAPQIIVRSR